jgi:hypothetical protein
VCRVSGRFGKEGKDDSILEFLERSYLGVWGIYSC